MRTRADLRSGEVFDGLVEAWFGGVERVTVVAVQYGVSHDIVHLVLVVCAKQGDQVPVDQRLVVLVDESVQDDARDLVTPHAHHLLRLHIHQHNSSVQTERSFSAIQSTDVATGIAVGYIH